MIGEIRSLILSISIYSFTPTLHFLEPIRDEKKHDIKRNIPGFNFLPKNVEEYNCVNNKENGMRSMILLIYNHVTALPRNPN